MTLDLGGTPINDVALAYLPMLSNLDDVNLSGCKRISDDGIKYLQNMKHLKRVTLVDCNISPEAAKALHTALPDARILLERPTPPKP